MATAMQQLQKISKLTTLDGWRWGLAKVETEWWERYLCVDTRADGVLGQRAVPTESIQYEPLPWFLIRRGVQLLNLKKDDVFVDYGAGLGRALLMAARGELKRVIGVELLPSLARIAARNVATAQHRLKTPVEVFATDATTWEVPDDVTVAYLFNPFVGSVMRAVQQKLCASLARKPRSMRILYAHADDQPDLFAPCPWLTLRRELDGGVYKSLHLKLYSTPHAEM